MIHHFYVGHFEKDGGAMKLQRRYPDGAPRPVVARPLELATIEELLAEKGVGLSSIPDEWWLGIDEDGFIVCDAYTRSRDAIDFIRNLATRTRCDVLYDGTTAFSPDDLTFPWGKSQGHAQG